MSDTKHSDDLGKLINDLAIDFSRLSMVNLAKLISDSAPRRRGRYSRDARIPWEFIKALRIKLEESEKK